jgi:hypothetical protein
VTSLIARFLRLASFVICLIVVASFVIFAANQTKSASKHQTEELSGKVRPGTSSSTGTTGAHESSLHKDVDEASEELTSPFAGIVPSSSSEWLIRGVKLALALAVYGFGLGFLARVLSVRV